MVMLVPNTRFIAPAMQTTHGAVNEHPVWFACDYVRNIFYPSPEHRVRYDLPAMMSEGELVDRQFRMFH